MTIQKKMLDCVAALAMTVLLLLSACRGDASPAANSVAHTRAGDIVLSGRVVDRANLIPTKQEQTLIAQLRRLEKETTDQVVIVTLPSLNGAPIEEIGRSLGTAWGIGRADLDNGVLLIVAPAERKVRIEVGLGLEGLVTDEKAAGIVRQMLPFFQTGQPAQAIQVAANATVKLLESDKRRPQRLIHRKAA
jgi:uncharacterized protein